MILEDIARQREVTQIEVVDADRVIIADGNEYEADEQPVSFLARSDSPVIAETLKTRKNVIHVSATHIDAAYPVLRVDEPVGAAHPKFVSTMSAGWCGRLRCTI